MRTLILPSTPLSRARYLFSVCMLWLMSFPASYAQTAGVTVTGELKKWHPITLTIDGPQANEEGATNPFLDYRLVVTFTDGSTTVTAPGYFAADGDAAETGATNGNKWRVHFVPRAEGTWNYTVSLRQGNNIAINSDANAGQPAAGNGLSGSFSVSNTDKAGSDFRGKGILRYVNKHYLQFDNGEYFIKTGANSPENFLAYNEFDNTVDNGCVVNDLASGLHEYQPHVADWNEGDPVWQSTKGKGIIGALNYLAGKGMNSVFFLTMNTQGDGCEVFPWTQYGSVAGERLRYDVSKLDQWDIVFSHMDQLGIMLHIVLQEQQNAQLLDGGDLETERKLYYRELIARFGYHLAITWNLGEEINNSRGQRIDFSNYIASLDPYGHHIVAHTFAGQERVFNDMLGYPDKSPTLTFTGTSIQVEIEDVLESITMWQRRSIEMGHSWVVALDEIGPFSIGASPDGPGNNHKQLRQDVLWATLMSGGAGIEWYFGNSFPNDDLDMEDWRSRDNLWDQTRFAQQFFENFLPFSEMSAAHDLTQTNRDYVFAKAGDTYAVYLKSAVEATPLAVAPGTYTISWYNPRNGSMQQGTVTSVTGPGAVNFGQPPSAPAEDWVVLLVGNGQGITFRAPDEPVNTNPGVQYAYYEGTWEALPDFSALVPLVEGVVDNFDISPRLQGDFFGFFFETFINVPQDGLYTFYTYSDAGSRLVIGNQIVVDNDGLHPATEKQGTIALSQGLHSMNVLYFDRSGETQFNVFWTPPGGSKQVIPNANLVFDSDNLLPVELVDFTGFFTADEVALTWSTASELNNAAFEVQRAIDDSDAFVTIGTVEGAGTTSETREYRFVDAELPAGARSTRYRLKQIDFDGAVDYSDVIMVPLALPEQTELDPNFPNPFNPSTTITFSLPAEQLVNLSVYDAAGRLVDTLVNEVVPAGHHSVVFEAGEQLASGLYVYRLETPTNQYSGSMMLLK